MLSLSSRTRQVSLALGAVLVASLVAPPDAQAYLDPATGSAIIQMVVAGVMGALFVIKTYWHNLKSYFSGSTKDDEAQASPDASVAGDDDE
jgi:hypothetical protein